MEATLKEVKEPLVTEQQLKEEGFTSLLDWEDEPADCLVVACSDPRFEPQTDDFLRHLGFQHPHKIQIPSGVALTHPATSLFGFLSKAFEKILEKTMELTHIHARTIVCIAHSDCGGYKEGSTKLIDLATRRFAGKSIQEIQIEHLTKAAKRLQLLARGFTVRAFYADVVEISEQGSKHHRVNFREILLH